MTTVQSIPSMIAFAPSFMQLPDPPSLHRYGSLKYLPIPWTLYWESEALGRKQSRSLEDKTRWCGIYCSYPTLYPPALISSLRRSLYGDSAWGSNEQVGTAFDLSEKHLDLLIPLERRDSIFDDIHKKIALQHETSRNAAEQSVVISLCSVFV